MNEIFLTIFFISLLLFLLGSGVWVALSMIAVSAVGMMLFTTRPVGDAMATTIWGTSSSWTLTALPLFVWMGEILFRTKLSENLFKGLSPWLSKLPGGLIHVNVVGCGLFAAISGSSAATVATVGKMSIPELRKRKYPEKILLGSLAGSGTLGDYEGGEKYYLQGLALEPNHIGINEYLGELYVVTNRIDLAKERLKILKDCNCEEYDELKEIIQGTKKSKY